MPFLMIYKFFLPVLKLILCIIEVLCAIKNPIKLIKAMRRLFRNCLPDFLNLFPIFAIIMMIIALLKLLWELIQYIIQQIIKLIKLILRNILALKNAMMHANETSILAIAKKIGALLCIFQSLFVLLSLFSIIINAFRDILAMIFSIPPCSDDDPDGCCTTDVCPSFVKQNFTRTTGSLQYLNKVQSSSPFDPTNPIFNITTRNEGWQLYDISQEQIEQFRNIFDA
jgi:hypothetical protein